MVKYPIGTPVRVRAQPQILIHEEFTGTISSYIEDWPNLVIIRKDSDKRLATSYIDKIEVLVDNL